jgi:chorismate mutase
MALVRGIRGATTATSNTKEAILEATAELLASLVEANDVQLDDVAAVYFTTTDDLNAEFPAQAARHLGWEHVALLGGREAPVPNATARCIRVLLLVNTDKAPDELRFIYLRGAENLRDRGMQEA